MTNEMTAKEAVKQIKENCYFASISEKTKQALEMAIKALEAQPSDTEQNIVINNHPCEDCYYNDGDVNAECILCDKIREAQPADAVSREAVLDVINFEDEWLFDANGHNANTHIAFSGLESRVKALPSVTPKYTDEEIDKAQAVEQAYVDKMVELAVEETKRPKGKWIRVVDKAGHWVWECDCKWQQRFATNFCPNCGAEMGGADETN